MILYSEVAEERRINATSPIPAMKARKNTVEIEGMRACHLRDGAAMVSVLCDLEERVARGEHISEVMIDELVGQSRQAFGAGRFLEPSFATIAGVNANAAIIHYRCGSSFTPSSSQTLTLLLYLLLRATKERCAQLTGSDLLLLDSGGQYLDGTTGKYSTSYHCLSLQSLIPSLPI